MNPASTFAILTASLPAGTFVPEPLVTIDAMSLVPLLAALLGVVVALVVARARRRSGSITTAPADARDFRDAA